MKIKMIASKAHHGQTHPLNGYIEFRVTRDRPYRDPNCRGHLDLGARNGHYTFAPPGPNAAFYAATMIMKEFGEPSAVVELDERRAVRFTATGKRTMIETYQP